MENKVEIKRVETEHFSKLAAATDLNLPIMAGGNREPIPFAYEVN